MTLTKSAELLLVCLVATSESARVRYSPTYYAELIQCTSAEAAEAFEYLLDRGYISVTPCGAVLVVQRPAVEWVRSHFAPPSEMPEPMPSIEQIAEYLLIEQLHLRSRNRLLPLRETGSE